MSWGGSSGGSGGDFVREEVAREFILFEISAGGVWGGLSMDGWGC